MVVAVDKLYASDGWSTMMCPFCKDIELERHDYAIHITPGYDLEQQLMMVPPATYGPRSCPNCGILLFIDDEVL